MSAKIDEPKLRDAFEVMRNGGPRGGELAGLLERRGTRVRTSARVASGFTLNFINTIFLQPLSENAGEWELRWWVTLLAHEACHVEQGFWVDSIQQELTAYQTQCRVADELSIAVGNLQEAFASLNPARLDHLNLARAKMLDLFAAEAAAVVYASLPSAQPRGVRAIAPGVREIAAVVRASRQVRK